MPMSEKPIASTSEPPLRRGLLFAFALPSLMMGFMHSPESQIQGIYAKHAGLSLTALAAAMLFTRMFDAITYPLIGHWSDLSFRKTGSRKPWLMAGTALTVTGLWFLYRPPADVTIAWFTVWTLVTYIGWKVTEIPYSAWAVTLSSDYVQRARVNMWRVMTLLLGNVLFYVVPYAVKALGLSDTTELDLHLLGFTAVVIAACVPLINLYAMARVPDGEASPPPPEHAGGKTSWRKLFAAMRGNRPLLHLTAMMLPFNFFNGMSTGAIYLYLDSYLHLGKDLPLLMLTAMPFTLLALPFWSWLCLRYERHRVLSVAMLVGATAYTIASLAPVSSGLPLLMVFYPITIFCVVALAACALPMMGDVIDYDRLRTGENRAGLYTAVLSFLGKSILGLASAFGFATLGWLHFDAAASEQSVSGAFAIRLVVMWLPALGGMLAGILAWSFPITRARQAQIRAELQARDAAASIGIST